MTAALAHEKIKLLENSALTNLSMKCYEHMSLPTLVKIGKSTVEIVGSSSTGAHLSGIPFNVIEKDEHQRLKNTFMLEVCEHAQSVVVTRSVSMVWLLGAASFCATRAGFGNKCAANAEACEKLLQYRYLSESIFFTGLWQMP